MSVESVEQVIAALKRDDWETSHVVTDQGVVFASERTARIAAEKTGRELAQIPLGWLLKEPPTPAA